MKILITTFGPELENTMAAMRALPYEKLVLVIPEDEGNSAEIRTIRESEDKTKGVVELVKVDQYDLKDCFRNIVDFVMAIQSGDGASPKGQKNVININISGGTKIMGDGALLAAIHLGVPAYHCEKSRTIKIPVIRGINLRDRFTEAQLTILKQIGTREIIEHLSEKLEGELTPDTIKKNLRKLKKMGVIHTFPADGRIVTELTEAGILVLETISRFERKE